MKIKVKRNHQKQKRDGRILLLFMPIKWGVAYYQAKLKLLNSLASFWLKY